MKTYILTLSKKFPKGHKKEGELTFFKEKFMFGQQCHFCPLKNRNTNCPECDACLQHNEPIKLHTIRANYDLWAKRFAEVERGEAIISVRQWTDKPYRSPQIEIARLTKTDGIGIQKLKSYDENWGFVINTSGNVIPVKLTELAKNDGLKVEDWENWFKNYDRMNPMVIIHFTRSRYNL